METVLKGPCWSRRMMPDPLATFQGTNNDRPAFSHDCSREKGKVIENE
jgi:hypothetical protein